jgi:hypothetical protein
LTKVEGATQTICDSDESVSFKPHESTLVPGVVQFESWRETVVGVADKRVIRVLHSNPRQIAHRIMNDTWSSKTIQYRGRLPKSILFSGRGISEHDPCTTLYRTRPGYAQGLTREVGLTFQMRVCLGEAGFEVYCNAFSAGGENGCGRFCRLRTGQNSATVC